MAKKVLVTGGPVHAHLDAVKIITNRFRGGLMAQTAIQLAELGAEVTYLCAPSASAIVPGDPPGKSITVIAHHGFHDYHKKVLDLAAGMDGVVLGAAVANLIPKHPIQGKFPSHNYKPGDTVPWEFIIAPRIIDDVKKVAPKTHLFGYKLLDGVEYEELIRAAYGIVLEAKATAVFANDATDLNRKFAVTKERGVHPMMQNDIAYWIWEMLHDEYYRTVAYFGAEPPKEKMHQVRTLVARFAEHFTHVEDGLVFGTVAVRCGDGFITTGRGKREIDTLAHVTHVDHKSRVVYAANGGKASLNAPLLAKMFENPAVDHIVHYHEHVAGLHNEKYAPPGTVRDTMRFTNQRSFNIAEHGCILLFDKHGRQL